jgi:hypothetical protein
MVTPASGIASPFFLPLPVIATPRLVGCWADVPTCGLTCPDSGLGGPHAPWAQSPSLCGHTSPTLTWTVGPAPRSKAAWPGPDE